MTSESMKFFERHASFKRNKQGRFPKKANIVYTAFVYT